MNWGRAAALAAGGVALVWIISSVGIDIVARDVALAGWALPLMTIVHGVQLYLSALAWRLSLGGAGLSPAAIFRIRWVREGVNALLPVAQIGGQVVGTRLLVHEGLAPALAVAGTILDLTLEAAAQLIFTLAGIGALLMMSRDHSWLSWVGGGLFLTALGVAGFIAAQRLGLMRLIERGVERMATTWPATANWSMAGLHDRLMARQADIGAVAKATATHTLSWAIGGLEVWIALRALGHGVTVLDAVVIESLGMAARSAGFAVPGAVGVQEGGFVLVCGLFGVPAEPALALSVLKRLRELLVGAPALVVWQVRKDKEGVLF
jgi:putative membrane protein